MKLLIDLTIKFTTKSDVSSELTALLSFHELGEGNKIIIWIFYLKYLMTQMLLAPFNSSGSSANETKTLTAVVLLFHNVLGMENKLN